MTITRAMVLALALSACGGKADDDSEEPGAALLGAAGAAAWESDLPITDDGSRIECWNCAGADSE